MALTVFFLSVLFVIGAAVGSFTSVVIYRLHANEKGIFGGRSKCPDCETRLAPLDLIPLASYLTLRGQCRHCSKKISYMYPLLELVTGGLFAVLFFKFPFVNEILQFDTTQLGMYVLYALYIFVLIFTFFFDLHYFKIADEILLPAVLIGLIATIATPLTPHIFDALLGMGIAVSFFGLQALISRGTWIGLGDLRVGAFMGVILGLQLTIVALVLSYFIGSFVSLIVIARTGKFRGVKIPFAPMLVSGTLVTIFVGQELLDWYLRSLGF